MPEPSSTAVAQLPITQLLLIVFSWFSIVLYFVMIVQLIRKKIRLPPELKNLTLFYSPMNLLLFLHIELVMRPRKFRWFPLYDTNDQWLVELTVFGNIQLPIAVMLKTIPFALNTFTAVVHPKYHKQVWTSLNVFLSSIIIWLISSVATSFMYWTGSNDTAFVFFPNGIRQMTGDKLHIFASRMFTGFCAFSVITSSSLYVSAVLKTRSKKLAVDDRRLLWFCVVDFSPMIFESIRAALMELSIQTNNATMMVLIAEAWFYICEIHSVLPIYVLIIFFPSVRKVFRELVHVPLHALIPSKISSMEHGAPAMQGRTSSIVNSLVPRIEERSTNVSVRGGFVNSRSPNVIRPVYGVRR